MDDDDGILDLIFAAVLVISTLAMVLRLWQDWIVAVCTGLMMISFAYLILSLCKKITSLEKTVEARERTLRVNLENVTNDVNTRCDAMENDIDTVIETLSKRVYR